MRACIWPILQLKHYQKAVDTWQCCDLDECMINEWYSGIALMMIILFIVVSCIKVWFNNRNQKNYKKQKLLKKQSVIDNDKNCNPSHVVNVINNNEGQIRNDGIYKQIINTDVDEEHNKLNLNDR